MWWGDHVTVSDWSHVWISEGFASYTEALYYEATLGGTSLRDYMVNMDAGPYAGTVVGPPYIWDSIVYDKGAWVAHMLRRVIGDAAFFTLLTDFQAAHAYGNADTDDFIAAAEAAHGADLDWFFDPWLFAEGRPSYQYEWIATGPGPGGHGVEITLEQTQSASFPVYEMPIDVVVTTTEGTESFVVVNDMATQVFNLSLPAPASAVALDPDRWILGDFEEVVVDVPDVVSVVGVTPASPNPVRAATTFTASLSQPGTIAVRVFDVSGRHVRTLHRGRVAAGAHRFTWDARTRDGERAAPGRYFVRLVGPDGVFEEPLTVVR